MENVKNITAEKTVLYFDKESYSQKIGSIGYFVRDYANPLVDELKALKVELTKDLIFEIIDRPSTLERYFKNKAKEDSKSLAPVFLEYAEKEYMKMIEKGTKLATSASEAVSRSELRLSFLKDNIVFDENFKATTNPKYVHELRELYTEYLEDSEHRMAIFEQQKVVIQEYEKLWNLIGKGERFTSYDAFVEAQLSQIGRSLGAPKVEIRPIAYPDHYHDGILDLNHEGELTLNKENLGARIK